MFSLLVLILNFMMLSLINLAGIAVSNVIAIFVIFIQSIAFILDTFTSKGVLKRFQAQFVLGYILRVFLCFFDRYGQSIYSLPNSGADSEVYFGNAVTFAETDTMIRSSSFSQTFGYIMKFIGTNRLIAQYVIVLTSLLVLVMFAKTILMLKVDHKHANVLMFVFCLLPNFAIQSSIFIREIAIAVCASVSIYLFVYWMRTGNYVALIVSFASVFAGAWFHAGIVSMTLGYILIIFLYNPHKKSYIFSTSGLVFAILFTACLLFLYVNYSDTFFQKFNNVNSVEDVSENVERGASSYAKYVGSSKNPLNMVIFTIPRMFYFIFSPLPWQWRNPVDMFSFFCSSMYYFINLYCCFKTLRMPKGQKRNIAIALLIISLCGLFVFGWGVNNTGTALRHRDKMVMVFGFMLINYYANYDEDDKPPAIEEKKEVVYGQYLD